MVQVDKKVQKSMKLIAAQFPEFTEFLEQWKMMELEQIPDVPNELVGLARGRCKVLKELTEVFKAAPNWDI